ncbi:isocitrate dehydrogenase kinase/phosphatase (AceK) domain-containing protein [Ditylenchus destructor]|nr:isocitrate dehydrogenase kinase/phosphatase (AceK) domain-containing protein [Ditylenchus destructor]
MFPHELNDPRAFEIAQAMLEGFDKHYRLFRAASATAKQRFERADWHGQQRAQRERIEFYDLRVDEAVAQLEQRYKTSQLPSELLPQRLHLRAAGHLDRIHRERRARRQPTYRCYYPSQDTLRDTLMRIVWNFQLSLEFEDLQRDVDKVLEAIGAELGSFRWRTNFQVQVLSSLFFGTREPTSSARSSTASPRPRSRCPSSTRKRPSSTTAPRREVAGPAVHRRRAVRRGRPADAVQLRAGLLHGRHGSALGLGAVPALADAAQAARRNLQRARPRQAGQDAVLPRLPQPPAPQQRQVPHRARHQGHGDAGVRPAFVPVRVQGHQGLLPAAEGHHARADQGQVPDGEAARPRRPHGRYARVHPGRVPAPSLRGGADRRAASLLPSLLEENGDDLVIKHLYIERRMVPLNIYLQEASPAQVAHAVVEYGNAIKDMVAANIFPGDMLYKNFGVTRLGRVVFYDYDEIEYITDCNFRAVPEARNEEDELSGEVWYPVGKHDVFPETFGPFLLGHPGVRDVFMEHHADLLDPAFWQGHKQRIQAGHVEDVFPYDPHKRFHVRDPVPALKPPEPQDRELPIH